MTLDPDELAALTFDCYGTIIDWEAGMLRALQPWRERTGLTAADAAVLAAFGALETRVQRERPAQPYPRILAEVLHRLGIELGAPATAGEAAAFGASVGDWPPFPDSRAALLRLRQRYRLVVVSNVDRASFDRTRRALAVEFDALVCAGEVGAYKPDPRMFEAALRTLAALSVPTQRVLHVAQSLYHDHVPAKRFGLRTAWVDRRRGRSGPGATPATSLEHARPDLIVGSLAELADRLAPEESR